MPDADSNGQSAKTPEKRGPRQWIVPTAFRLPNGEVVADREGMRAALEDLAPILQRIGGTATIATRRVEVIPGAQTETSSIVIRWEPFSSLASGTDAKEEIQPLEPELVAVGDEAA